MQSSFSDSEIFRVAAKLPPERRSAFLEQACAGDCSLRADVESLLRAHDQPGSFLQSPASATITLPDRVQPGDTIGPYKLREQIGEGGFGIVYVAEQEHPVRRKVALKVIKPGMDTKDVIARFEAERQALALMDHPNVARVFDAGATPSGRPYFVMELVQGVEITEYCDRNSFRTRERLALFTDICRAVQHAHQKGIVHRDLKPSNIMVTLHDGKPVVKVIDFGVSKALSQQLTEKSIYTAYGQMIGTPAYMSPEQAEMSGLGIDTRSDIYSLGVLLYELLTGQTPLDTKRLREGAYAEILRIIRDEEPPRPSVKVSTLGERATVVAQQRHTNPKQLSRDLSGELDWVVMKCLEKDRSRRYETASGLAIDIERHLRDEPVEACPPSTWYRLNKAARKYRQLCLTASAFVLLLIGGAALASWLAVRATFAEKQARLAKVETERALHNEQTARRESEAAKLRAESFTQRLREATQLSDEGIEHFNRGNWAASHASFQRAQETESELWSTYAHRAKLYLRLGLWDEARQDYDERRRVAAHFDARTLYEHAVLQLATGDETGYRQTCQELRQQADNWDNNYYLIRACVISTASGVDAADIARRAEDRLTAEFSGFHGHLAGRAHLRVGNLPQAQQRLDWGQAPPVNTPGGVHRIGNAFHAICLHRQGKTAEAQAELAKTEVAIDEWTQEMLGSGVSRLPIDWWDWLEALLVEREARMLLSGMSPADDPRLATLRDRSLAMIHGGDAQSLMVQARECLQRADWDGAAANTARVLDNPSGGFRASSQELWYCLEMVQKPVAFERLAALRPNDSRLWFARGRWHANQRQWPQAASDYRQALRCIAELVPSTDMKRQIGLQRRRAAIIQDLAAILLLAEDFAGYEQLCANTLALQGEFDDPFAFCCLARTCSLGTSALSDTSAPVRWGQIAADTQPHNAWHAFSLGIAHFRARDFAAADKACEKSLEVHPTWFGRGQNYAVLAMACQRLGQPDRARAWLTQAQDAMAMMEESRIEWKYGMAASDYLSDWLGLLLLLPEAEALLQSPKATITN
jgi:eukaryotic-like serine/threonine-protein kinase